MDISEKQITKRNRILLWIGNWTSNAGNRIFDYANSILILSFGKTAIKVMALYQGSETLVAILLNLIGGVAADGSSKKKICVITDLVSALICFVLALLVKSPIIGMAVVIANIFLACVSAFNSPTYKSIIREVIAKDFLISFNSIMHGVNEAIGLIAPVLALVLVNKIGVIGALCVDGFTFLLSAVLEYNLKPLPGYEIIDVKRKRLIHELRAGFKYMLGNKKILFLIVMSAGINFFLSAYNLSLPFSENILGEGYYSKALIAEASGGIIGSLICTVRKKEENSLKIMGMYLGSAGLALAIVPFGVRLINNKLCVLGLIFLFSMLITIYNVKFFTYVQMTIQQDFLGRIFSIINTVALLFVPIGALFFSFILSFEDLFSFYVSGGGMIIISSFAFLVGKIIQIKKN